MTWNLPFAAVAERSGSGSVLTGCAWSNAAVEFEPATDGRVMIVAALRGTATVKMTTREIMALTRGGDQALLLVDANVTSETRRRKRSDSGPSRGHERFCCRP